MHVMFSPNFGYAFGELDEVVLAYATTIHKSQGSEYPAVVIPLTTQHYMMLQRNLLYTGVTRGKCLVILLGQKKAVAIAVKNVSGRRRWSKLREWMNPVCHWRYRRFTLIARLAVWFGDVSQLDFSIP